MVFKFGIFDFDLYKKMKAIILLIFLALVAFSQTT